MRYLHSVDESLCKGKDEDGYTALALAIEYCSKETVELLITEFNADIHKLSYNGRNCVHCAVIYEEDLCEYDEEDEYDIQKIQDILKLLHSIDDSLFRVKDLDGKTAFDLGSRWMKKFMIDENFKIDMTPWQMALF